MRDAIRPSKKTIPEEIAPKTEILWYYMDNMDAKTIDRQLANSLSVKKKKKPLTKKEIIKITEEVRKVLEKEQEYVEKTRQTSYRFAI